MMNKKSTLFSSRSSLEFPSMIYLCRFRQRNRLIEIPITSEYYNQQNGISHEHLKYLIIQEFQLQQIIKTTLIIQIWNEQYQDYIDIESFKQIPFEGRLQVLIEKDLNSIEDSFSLISKNSSTTIRNTNLHDEVDSSSSSQINIKIERIYDESINTISSIDNLSNCQNNIMYDLLPKPNDGIPVPHFPPHILAFLNGNANANQLNALVQVLYQEIVKYELYPNADELRSIVNRLVNHYPYCISVIGSIELLVRKLYYKFCNERKKYPMELKRRQTNKRKRFIHHNDSSNNYHNSSLDHFMHLWTTTISDQQNLPSPIDDSQKSYPLNLSISMNNNTHISSP